MKAEERADDLIHETSVFGLNRNIIVRAIKEAEQQARNEALEEAAKLFWTGDGNWPNWLYGTQSRSVADSIRALIEREGGE